MDTTIGREAYISHNGGLKTVESNPIIEDSFEKEILNEDFWEPFTRGSGYTKFKNGMLELHSGKSIGGLAKITSKKIANNIPGQNLIFEASLNMNSYNLKQPSIRYGAYSKDNSSALYFDFNSSSFFRFLYPVTNYNNNTFKLHNNFSNVNDFYKDYYSLLILDNNHNYEIKKIIGYNGTTKIATLESELEDIITNNSKYFLLGHVLEADNDSITIPKNSIDVEDFYKGDLIYIYDGKGKGQLRGVSSYDSLNKIIVVSGWDIIPDNTSRFIITSKPLSADVNSMIIKDGFSNIEDRFKNIYVMIIYGSGSGQIKKIKNYIGSEKKVILEKNWDSIPNFSVFQCVMRVDGFNYSVTSNNFDGLKNWIPPDHNISYKIIINSELIEFYISQNGRLQRLTTFKGIDLNYSAVSEYNMLFASSNINGNINNFLQIRECNISSFGNQKLIRPTGNDVTEKSLSYLNTSVLLGKTNDNKFKNILVNNDGKLLIEKEDKEDKEDKDIRYIIGKNYDVDDFEVPENIWQFGQKYTFLNKSENLIIRSNKNEDTLNDSGARTLKLLGLNDNYEEIEETINMNGKNNVSSINKFLRLNDAFIFSAGIKNTNEGLIYVLANKLFLAKINQGTNSALNAIFSVPKNKTAYINRIFCSSFLKKGKKEIFGGNVELKIRKFNQVFITKTIFNINETINFLVPIKVEEKSDIILEIVNVNTKDLIVTGGFDLELK